MVKVLGYLVTAVGKREGEGVGGWVGNREGRGACKSIGCRFG